MFERTLWGLGVIGLIAALVLVTIWIGYPLVISAIARLCRPIVDGRWETAPMVSVVLATRDSDDVIRERVANLLATSYDADRIEVIISLDAGRLVTQPVEPSSDARVRVVTGDSPPGKAGALNAGVRAAHGQILVFADAHQRFDVAAIPCLVSAMHDPRVGAVTGHYSLAPGGNPLIARYWNIERWLRRQEARVHSSIGVTGAIWALHRDLWQPLPADLILDDLYTPMRVVMSGRRVAFAERAFAMESRHLAGEAEFARKVRTLTGVLQFCAWMPSVLSPLRNPVWAQLVFHKLLRMASPVLVLLVVLGGAAMLGFVAISQPSSRAVLALVLTVALALSFHRSGRVARRVMWDALTFQLAFVHAMRNGLRRRWRVWT